MSYYNVGRHTESAGTVITELCPHRDGMIPVLTGFSYTAAATEHSLYVCSPLGVLTTTSYVAAGGTSMEVSNTTPGKTTAGESEVLASGDYLAFVTEHGNVETNTVSSVSNSTITLGSGVTNSIPTGAKVFAFYEYTRGVHLRIPLTASVTTTLDSINVQGGIPRMRGIEFATDGVGHPMLIVSTNATNAGTLNWATFTWLPSDQAFAS